jgi:hypothetical protein
MKLKYYLLAIAALVVSSASAQSNSTFAKDYMSLSGYLQGGFQTPGVGGDEPSSTFYLKRARVSLTGNVPQDNIDYRLQVDMAGSPKICDLYFRYKPSAAFNVQLGQFKIPFAIENDIYGPTTVEFIDYSYITTLLARNADRFDGISAGGRDIGLQLYGGFGEARGYNILSYNLGIFNGAGINKADNNDAKDVVARLIFKPSKELSLSASWMSAATNYEAHIQRSNRTALGVIYDASSFIVRSEYALAKFDDRNVDAFYVMGGYKLKRGWMLVARYETLNDGEKHGANRVTFGAVFKPYSYLRFQLNYAIEDTSLQPPKYYNTSGLNLMVTAIF